MGRILSQEELDALLTSARDIERDSRARAGHASADAVPYDFGRPDRASKDQIKVLELLLERFAGSLGTSLSAFLRASVDAKLRSIEQFSWSEVLRALPDPTAIYSVSLAPFDGRGVLELNPVVAFTIIDRLLGGRGRYAPVTRPLTEIEQNVIDAVIRVVLERLVEALRPMHEVQFKIEARETRPQMLQVAVPSESMLLVAFDIAMAEVTGTLHLCVPAVVGSSFGRGWQATRREPTPAETQRLLHALGAVRVPLAATLAAQLPAREILALRPGDVLALGVPAREPIEVRAWRTLKFLAHPVRTATGVGLRVQSCLVPTGEEAAK